MRTVNAYGGDDRQVGHHATVTVNSVNCPQDSCQGHPGMSCITGQLQHCSATGGSGTVDVM